MKDPVLVRRRKLWTYLSDRRGHPPTHREIVDDLGYGSVGSVVRDDIRALANAGYIHTGHLKQARSITVLIPLVSKQGAHL